MKRFWEETNGLDFVIDKLKEKCQFFYSLWVCATDCALPECRRCYICIWVRTLERPITFHHQSRDSSSVIAFIQGFFTENSNFILTFGGILTIRVSDGERRNAPAQPTFEDLAEASAHPLSLERTGSSNFQSNSVACVRDCYYFVHHLLVDRPSQVHPACVEHRLLIRMVVQEKNTSRVDAQEPDDRRLLRNTYNIH